jgi:hypothetical protein
MPLPSVDAQCPVFGVGGLVVPPCCTEAGMCGLDASFAGLGCIDLGHSMLRSLRPTRARRCDGASLEAEREGRIGPGASDGITPTLP